jgi:hypothetical protein
MRTLTPTVRSLAGFCALGAVLTVLGFVVDLRRTLFAYLTAYVFVASIAVGAILFLAIAHTTGAGWMAVLRRRAEDIASIFPILIVLFVPIALGLRVLYPWARAAGTWSDEMRAHIVPKLAYLNPGFFLVRALVCLGSWTALAELLRRASQKQDTSSSPALGELQTSLAAATLPWMAFTLTFAAFDWLMSLDPSWSSNVFGIYLFAGGFGAASGLLALLVFGPVASRVRVATPEHAHALGRILLTFVIFWAYIAFTQYMLIWLADLPDELPWVKLRTAGPWGKVAVTLAVGHFVLPFAALLSRDLKRRPLVLSVIGAWLVLAHYVDVYWVVLPQVAPAPRPHWVDLGTLLFVGGACALVAVARAGTEAEVPTRDPAVARGLAYEVTQ